MKEEAKMSRSFEHRQSVKAKNKESIEVESRSSQGNDTNWGKCNGKGLIITIVVA
jgi:hypothetical protein